MAVYRAGESRCSDYSSKAQLEKTKDEKESITNKQSRNAK